MQYLGLCMPEVLFGKEIRKDSKKCDGAVPSELCLAHTGVPGLAPSSLLFFKTDTELHV